MANDRERWYVTRDGARKSPLLKTENEAWTYIQKHQGQSVDWAMRYEGWSVAGPYELQPEDSYGTDDVTAQEEIECARVDAAHTRREAAERASRTDEEWHDMPLTGQDDNGS